MNKKYGQVNINTELTKLTEQYYEVNTPYIFKEAGCYYLFYVTDGQIQLLIEKDSHMLNTSQAIILKCSGSIHLFVSMHPANVMTFVFNVETGNITQIENQIFKIGEKHAYFIESLKTQLKTIHFIKRTKPSIVYDKEIGSYFNVSCSVLHSTFTRFLLFIYEKAALDALPLTFKSTILELNKGIEPHHTMKQTIPVPSSKHKYDNELITKIISYMKSNLDRTLTIDEIAEYFFLGTANLKKIFKKETGDSIIHYFNTLKMEAAQVLICTNELSYTEIAEKLGFNSVHHFSAAFKKYTGYSPSKYFELTKANNK